MSTTLFPAIRSKVGDWITYVTTMAFRDIHRLVKAPDEVHERQKLSDWIQREAIDSHSEEIAKYIRDNPQRFLGALIVGVYDGSPDWAPLSINFSIDQWSVCEEQQKQIEGRLGLLKLSGSEKLFAIDGQHRVAGIKKYAESNTENISLDDEVSAIFVSHDNTTEAGKRRTRRLFTTVNKKAKKISKAAIIALDEDNGFAIATRRIIDEYPLFEDKYGHVSYSSTGSIGSGEINTITSVVGLYEIIRDLFPRNKRGLFEKTRPTDSELDSHISLFKTYMDRLLELCPEYKSAFVDRVNTAQYYREEKGNLLFRPIGQRTFAKATELLMSRGGDLDAILVSLLDVDLDVRSDIWEGILWDPVTETMITNRDVFAETQLLVQAGYEARTRKNAERLEEFLQVRDNPE